MQTTPGFFYANKSHPESTRALRSSCQAAIIRRNTIALEIAQITKRHRFATLHSPALFSSPQQTRTRSESKSGNSADSNRTTSTVTLSEDMLRLTPSVRSIRNCQDQIACANSTLGWNDNKTEQAVGAVTVSICYVRAYRKYLATFLFPRRSEATDIAFLG